jgi:hypothetical protein
LTPIFTYLKKEAKELIKDVKILSADDLEKNIDYLEKALLKVMSH